MSIRANKNNKTQRLADEYSPYRSLWIMVAYDLPTIAAYQRKSAREFHKQLIEDGYHQFQYSIYFRHCFTADIAETHLRRLDAMLPKEGKVMSCVITDRQYSSMLIFFGEEKQAAPSVAGKQLVLEFF